MDASEGSPMDVEKDSVLDTSQNRRVKLYELDRASGGWGDKGTGHFALIVQHLRVFYVFLAYFFCMLSVHEILYSIDLLVKNCIL